MTSLCNVRASIAALLCLTATAVAEPPTPFDRIAAAYAPYLAPNDPFGWPAKAWSLSADEYKFWRGSKDLFFLWCNDHCADWRTDAAARVPSHGDLHLGNVGSYASEGRWGTLAFGMVDFDDACALPFQIELLQGFITWRLMAGDLAVDASQTTSIDATLIDSYRGALEAGGDASTQLSLDPVVAKLLAASQNQSYETELAKFCVDGRFRSTVRSGKGKVTDVLQPIDVEEFDALADAIAEACLNDLTVAGRMRTATAAELRSKLKSAAKRTRLGSSGSQGLDKLLILLERPFKDVDSDVILYLKQQIPTAAERSGFVHSQARSPGERFHQMTRSLTAPRPFVNSFTTYRGRSYGVSLKEPWSDELSDTAKTVDELRDAVRRWGTVAGSAQRDPARRKMILDRLDGALTRTLATRAEAYLAEQRSAFRSFADDPRTAELSRQVTTAFERQSR